MPYSAPVDTNPIAKTPAIATAGDPLPSNTIAQTVNLDFSNPAGIYFDNVNNKLYLLRRLGGTDFQIRRYSGVSGTAEATQDFTGVFTPGFRYALIGDSNNLYVKDNSLGACQIAVISKSSLSLTETRNLTLQDSGVNIGVFSGDLLSWGTSTDDVTRYSGITDTVKDSVTINNLDTDVENAIGQLGDNLFFLRINSSTGAAEDVKIFEGFSITPLKEFNGDDTPYSDTTGLTTLDQDDQAKLLLCNGDDTVKVIQNVADGETFIVNTEKTLESGVIYSINFQVPNTVDDPTLNDDGQGAFTVVLPGDLAVPVGALVNNVDVLFNGSNYVIVTLTEELAQAIYNFPAAVVDNMTATTDPTVNDDSDDGYSVRSRWFNTVSGEAFLAVDVTVGAAIWVKASLTLDELGSAAVENVGTAVGNVPQLEDVGGGVAGMPAVDGSQLTDVAAPQEQIAQAWVNFDGTGTVSIRDHYNVSSITDNGTGDYTVNFSTNRADANYAPVTGFEPNSFPPNSEQRAVFSFNLTTSSVDLMSAAEGSLGDFPQISVAIFGGN